MGLLTGCHLIAAGSHSKAALIAPLIQKHGLLVDSSMFGTAAWAYYVDMVPNRWRSAPLVVFEVDEGYVIKQTAPLPNRQDYAFMKMPGVKLSYIQISVIGFCNLAGFPQYNGLIGFF